MDSTVDQIKKKIDIVDYIGSLITLKKAGRNYKANCPFHNENTPSFVVSAERQIWRCFGACQDGGDVISFLMKWDNLTFFEAVKELAEQAGIQLKDVKFQDRQWKEKEVLLKINSLSAKYYHYILTDHASGKEARDYLKNRGVTKKLIETFQLGYAPQSWDSLSKFLYKKDFKDKEISLAGLSLQSAKNKSRYYDRFRGRLMFPIIDTRKNILGFSGRLLTNSEKQAKYVNTPETPLYHKRETLYGIHATHEGIRKSKTAVIVEGEFDLISSYKNSITNAVAIKGSAFTKDQLMLLKRYTKHLVLALDADFSGTQTTLRAIKDAEEMDFRVDIIRYTSGKDPDEALEKDPAGFKKLLKKPMHIYDFIIETSLERHNVEDPYEKKEFIQDVLPFITSISNPIVKSHYTKRLADIIQSDERDVELSLRKFTNQEHRSKTNVPQKQTKPEDRMEVLQKYIMSYLLQHDNPPDLFYTIADIMDIDDFTIPSYHEILLAFKKYIDNAPENKRKDSFDVKVFSENFSDPLQAVLDELFLYDISAEKIVDDDSKAFKKTLLEFKRLSLKSKLKESVKSGDSSQKMQTLTQKLAQVEKELRVM